MSKSNTEILDLFSKRVGDKYDHLIQLDEIYNIFLKNYRIHDEWDVNTAFTKFKEWFYEDEFVYAKRLLDKIIETKNEKPSLKQFIANKVIETPEVAELLQDFQAIDNATSIVGPLKDGNKEGWNVFMDTADLKLYYR